MRSLLLSAMLLFLLNACAAQIPLQTHLQVQLGQQTAGLYPAGAAFSMEGKDQRGNQEVARYAIGNDPVITLTNERQPHVLLSELLAVGLQRQGLLLHKQGSASIQLIVDTLLVEVSKPKLLYSALATSKLRLIVNNKGSVFTRTFSRESSKESVRRPELPALEGMLNSQLTDILTQILSDQEIRATISK